MGLYNHHKSQNSDGETSDLVPCSDMSGTIVASRSPRWKVGARVASIFNQDHLSGQIRQSDMASGLGLPLQGVLAEYRVFPERGLVALPEYLTDEEAACLPIAGVTAWMSINGFQPLGQPHDYTGEKKAQPPSILLLGTGGVAMAGLQIASAAGFTSVITSSSDKKLEKAKALGASATINYRTHWEWQGPVLDATGGQGADFIIETGGARTLRKSFDSIAFGGTIACVGYTSGKGDDDGDGDLNRLNVNVLALRRNVTLKGILNGPRERFEEMLRFYEDKKIHPVVDRVFGFEDAVEAFGFLGRGEHFGKVVIRVSQ